MELWIGLLLACLLLVFGGWADLAWWKRCLRLDSRRTQFVQAIRNGKFTVSPISSATTITLGGGLKWFCFRYSVLFVRYFYEQFFSGVLQDLNCPGRTFVVIGNPGIGKSSFGMFLLFKAIGMGRTVVYQNGFFGICYLIENGQAFKVSDVSELWSTTLSDENVIYICDSIKPLVCEATTILITSPDVTVWRKYHNQMRDALSGSAKICLFPVFSFDEALVMCRQCYPEGVALLVERFNRWGGIPRLLFDEETLDDIEKEIKGAVDASGSLERMADIEFEEAAKWKTHRLVHFRIAGEVDDDPNNPPPPASTLAFYKYRFSEFASRWIGKMVLAEVASQDHSALLKFLKRSAGKPALSVIRGDGFAYYATLELLKGRSFPTRNLHTGVESLLKLAPSQRVDFFRASEIPALLIQHDPAEVFLYASSKIECAVDAIMPNKLPLNFTVSGSHSIKITAKPKDPMVPASPPVSGLESVASALGLAGAVNFYFVVPSDIYPKYMQPQPLSRDGVTLFPDGHKLTRHHKEKAKRMNLWISEDAVAKRVVQHALSIKV